MNQISTLMVDDEVDSRSILRVFLTKYCPAMLIVAEVSSVREAAEKIDVEQPQLVFLDINMPKENGFALFDIFPNPSFHTIFVTAHDQYALEAIKQHALGYILKPLDISELIATVNYTKELIDYQRASQNIQALLHTIQKMNTPEKIGLPVQEGFVYVDIASIIRCEAESNYTRFHFTDRTKMVICQTLGYYERKLKDHGFIRVHHHHLINIRYVDRYQKGRGGIVFMADKIEVAVSQRKKDEFLKLMQQSNIEIPE